MSPQDDLVALALPAYEIGDQVGRGGFGVVRVGRHKRLGRRVAIKELPQRFEGDSEVRRRFVAEATLMASIDHPHVVPVYDYVEHDGLCLLVMELLPGGTVASRFKSDGFDMRSAVAVALACASGLSAAHERGILHRDIKPDNLMFAASGVLKIADFGIAKVVGGSKSMATLAGDIIGTPSYIAPEQVRAEELSPATDIYALATVLYQLLTRELPFDRNLESVQMLIQHAYHPPVPLSDHAAQVPGEIEAIVMQGLATNQLQRFATAEEFGIELGAAAANCWGEGWIAQTNIPVLSADAILAAAGGASRPNKAKSPSAVSVSDSVRKRELVDTVDVPNLLAPQHLDLVATKSLEVPGAGPLSSDTGPVPSAIVPRSATATAPYLVAVVLGLLAIVVSVVGLGDPKLGGNVSAGTVSIAGSDPTTSDYVEIDTARTTFVTARPTVVADSVRLALFVSNVPVAQRDAPLVHSEQGGVAEVPALINPKIVAGSMTGEVTFLQGNNVSETYRFTVHTPHPAFATVVAVANVVTGLFAVAYLESNMRSLRRGRRSIFAVVGTPVCGAILAIVATIACWVALGSEPTAATLTASAVLGMLAGLACTVGASRVGRRRRLSRVSS